MTRRSIMGRLGRRCATWSGWIRTGAVGMLVVGLAVAALWYVQETLKRVEAALPRDILSQEREIVAVANAIDDLLLALRTARLSGEGRAEVMKRLGLAETALARMRRTYNFDNLVGASAVHAIANPALTDVRNWLESGVGPNPPTAPIVLALADRRIEDAIGMIRQRLGHAQESALARLGEQARALERFRQSLAAMILLVAGLVLLSVVLVVRQFAERKRSATRLAAAKEAAEQANLAKSRFLATMSHELRTPLNAIIGFSEIIRDRVLGDSGIPRYTDYAADIHRSGQHLLSLINDILDLAKVEAGRYDIHLSSVDFPSLARSSLRFFEPRARLGGIALSCDLPIDLPPLKGDERALRQILLNLLSNAVKFTLPGGQVRVTARRGQPGFLTIDIVDTGIGIPADKLAAALTPFEQVDNSLQRRYEGTGLGLPLAKSLVELHGGRLSIQSDPGKGTTVSIDLPADQDAMPADTVTGTKQARV